MPSVYVERRAKVLRELETGVLILFSAPVCFRNSDVAHEYRQDSDFYYLTGFDEAESVMILAPASEHPFQLFVLPKNPERETWDGERTGVDGAIERYAADAAYPISELPSKLPELLKGKTRLFYAIGRHPRNDDLVLTALGGLRERIRRGETCPSEIIEPSTVLHEMRMVKSPAEIDHLRRAIAITAEGHEALLNAVRPGMAEYELEAVLRGKYRALGSERCAYPPIVASGRNARVLHHRRNDRTIEDGELVLVDAAAEYGYMAADVTRTFPSGGIFSPAQRRAYEIVLRAEEEAIKTVRPGATLEKVHETALEVLCAGLVELGVLSGSPQDIIAAKSYQKYYMHRTSHWLGMDVHDVGLYFRAGEPRPLEAGMVFTVEPGLYFPREDDAVPEELKDIGIRIEDDVLVTETGVENLSQAIPRAVDEVERIMSSRVNR